MLILCKFRQKCNYAYISKILSIFPFYYAYILSKEIIFFLNFPNIWQYFKVILPINFTKTEMQTQVR